MSQKLIKRHVKQPEIAEWKLKILGNGEYPRNHDGSGWFFYYEKDEDNKRSLYESIKDDFVKDWISKHPCTRPWAWWHYDAPHGNDPLTAWYPHETFVEPRKHIGGGVRSGRKFKPSYYKGVFEYWNYTDDDPPFFESEASYLKRFDLLTKEEMQHLEKHPGLLKPVSIIDAIPGVESWD